MLESEVSTVFMSSSPQSRSSLLRLLAILEWVLLGTVFLAQILLSIANLIPVSIAINCLGLGIITVLGLIPPPRHRAKLAYTVMEFGLVFSLGFIGNVPLPAMLFILLVIRSSLRLEGRGRAIATGIALIGCILLQTYRLFYQDLFVEVRTEAIGTVRVGLLLVSGLVILFIHLLVNAVLNEREGQRQLTAANNRLRQYALRIEELAAVQERNRIAREIHDSLGHSLTVFSIHLEAALRLLQSDSAKVENLLLEMKQLNARTLQEVRQSVAALRADPLQKQSLSNAVAELIAEFQRSTGILPTSTIQLQKSLDREQKIAIYRIVQESLTNICKYAAATEVNIEIVQSPIHLQIIVEDNGQGFDVSQNTTGFGLQGMQERVLAMMGQLEIITAPGRGCRVEVVLPTEVNSLN